MKQQKFKVGIILTNNGGVISEVTYNPNIEKSPVKLKFYLVCDEVKKKFSFIPYGDTTFTDEDVETLKSLFEPENIRQLSKLAAIIVVTYKFINGTELSKEEFLTYNFVINDGRKEDEKA